MARKNDVRAFDRAEMSIRFGESDVTSMEATLRGIPGGLFNMVSRSEHLVPPCGTLTLGLVFEPMSITIAGRGKVMVSSYRMLGVGMHPTYLMLCGECHARVVRQLPFPTHPEHCPWCGAGVSELPCATGHAWGSCRVCLTEAAPFVGGVLKV